MKIIQLAKANDWRVKRKLKWINVHWRSAYSLQSFALPQNISMVITQVVQTSVISSSVDEFSFHCFNGILCCMPGRDASHSKWTYFVFFFVFSFKDKSVVRVCECVQLNNFLAFIFREFLCQKNILIQTRIYQHNFFFHWAASILS